jgi:hypothetical protein
MTLPSVAGLPIMAYVSTNLRFSFLSMTLRLGIHVRYYRNHR